MQLLQTNKNGGDWYISDWAPEADQTWRDAGPDNDFLVAPCLSGMTEDYNVRLVREYVIYVYGRNQLPVNSWIRIKQRLASEGIQTYLVGDLGGDAANRPYTEPERASTVTPYLRAFEASYVFDNISTAAACYQSSIIVPHPQP